MEHPILLFDGDCNLCNRGVNFVIDRDRNGVFRFASLQSAIGQELLRRHGLPTTDFDTFVMIDGDRLLTRSTAALHVARALGGIWSVLFLFIGLPRFFRDALYDVVARHRFRWFGRAGRCRVMTPELEERFLDIRHHRPGLEGRRSVCESAL